MRDIFLRELLENRGLAGIVQAQYQDTGFLVASLKFAQQRQEPHIIAAFLCRSVLGEMLA